jgi:hypothetical protein
MFSPLPKKKVLATYSKKARIKHRSIVTSPNSDDRQQRKRLVTLTSPVHCNSLPTSPSSISFSLSGQVDYEDDEASQAESEVQSRPELSPAHGLAFARSPDRPASPVSSSEHDSISDDELIPVGRGNKRRTRRAKKPQPLSKLRKSLNVRPKMLQLVVKRPTSVLSVGTLQDIKRGADGFDKENLVVLTVPKSRNRKRKVANSIVKLDILRGPHPPVDFENSDWSTVPYQDSLAQEQKEAFDAAEVTQESRFQQAFLQKTRLKEEVPKSLSKQPNRPSTKEVLLYAQLSSVSAPIMRRSSYDEESEDGYANGSIDEADGDLEQGMGGVEQEEVELDTVR